MALKLAVWVIFLSLVACGQVPTVPSAERIVTVAGIPGVVAAGAEWVLAWEGTDNADGLVGTAEGGVLFAKEQPRTIGQLDPDDNFSVFMTNTRGVGSLAMDTAGRIFGVERSCTDPGRRAGGECTEPTAVSVLTPTHRVLADNFNGEGLGRLNDLVADRLGGAYFTVGGAYYVDARGAVTSLGEGLRTNGIILSPDETTLYVTNRETIVAFDVLADGATTNRREFAVLEAGGVGDGMAVDGLGRLYVTSAPGVQVFSARGDYLGLIPTPRNAISVAFAGSAKKTLYIVGSGAALGPGGSEFAPPDGRRNNAKTIYRIPLLATGFLGRPK